MFPQRIEQRRAGIEIERMQPPMTTNVTLSVFDDLDDAGGVAISANAGDEASASVATPVVSRKRRREVRECGGIGRSQQASDEIHAPWEMCVIRLQGACLLLP
jgi:hypothetical protein